MACAQHLLLQRWRCAQAATVLPGGCTRGELTLSGQRQARELGAWLRHRYVDSTGFLPADYQVRLGRVVYAAARFGAQEIAVALACCAADINQSVLCIP